MLADLSGVKSGPPGLPQRGRGLHSPAQPLYARAEAAFAADSFETSISPGELDVSVSVSGVYLITETEVE